jgi:CRISPR-associated exonuclease Cas4
MHAFRDVETAAYCPRKLYYRKRDPEERTTPEEVARRRELAFEYERLLADDSALADAPIAVTPTQFRARLGSAKASLDAWDSLVDPAERNVFCRGRECHGSVHKLLDGSSPSLSLIFGGTPPEQGVWEPQSVRLVAAAKALSWERETAVERVFAEYPAYGVIRAVAVDTRRTAQYRAAVRTADSIDGPPARTNQRSKCDPCEYQSDCGVRTRSLRSLLGG